MDSVVESLQIANRLMGATIDVPAIVVPLMIVVVVVIVVVVGAR